MAVARRTAAITGARSGARTSEVMGSDTSSEGACSRPPRARSARADGSAIARGSPRHGAAVTNARTRAAEARHPPRPSGCPQTANRSPSVFARPPAATSITPVGSRVRTGYEQRPPRTYAPSRVRGGAIPMPGATSTTRRAANSSRWTAKRLRSPAVHVRPLIGFAARGPRCRATAGGGPGWAPRWVPCEAVSGVVSPAAGHDQDEREGDAPQRTCTSIVLYRRRRSSRWPNVSVPRTPTT